MPLFKVYPTVDIHLLMSDASTGMVLELWDAESSTDITGSSDISYLDFKSTVLSRVGTDGNEFRPAGIGVTTGRIRYAPSGESPQEVLVRVSVHQDVNELWFGNNRATVHEGESNYLLTVYARFTDNTQGDVTAHPWLTFGQSSTSEYTVSDTGWLTGDKAPSNPDVSVGDATVSKGSFSSSVPVYVLPKLSTARPILERIHTGSAPKKRNLLFLGEGYSDYAEFRKDAIRIKKQLFRKKNSPYYIIKEGLDIWIACEEAGEWGITSGHTVNSGGYPIPWIPHTADILRTSNSKYMVRDVFALAGLPDSGSPADGAAARTAWVAGGPAAITDFDPGKLQDEVYDAWKAQVFHGFPQARDSRLGFRIGGRYGDRRSSSPLGNENEWYIPQIGFRVIVPDPRRIEEFGSYQDFFDQYVSSLKFGTNTSDPLYNIGNNWTSTGDDVGLVGVIVNEEIAGGAQYRVDGVNVLFAVSVGGSKNFHIQTSGLEVDRSLSKPKKGKMYRVGTALAHEFTHAFNVEDEYHGYDYPDHNDLSLAEEADQIKVDKAPNLMSYHTLESSGGTHPVDATKIKWNWPRILLSSMTIADPKISGSTLEVDLEEDQGKKWTKMFQRHPDLKVYLRTADLNTYSPSVPYFLSGPHTISSVSGDQVILNGGLSGSTSNYPAGSCLYIPKRQEDNFDVSKPVFNIIHPKVYQYLLDEKKPLTPTVADCNVPETKEQYPPDDSVINNREPRDVTFVSRVHRERIVGVYEGGGTWNCKAYRPTGYSKMRQHEKTIVQVIERGAEKEVREYYEVIEFGYDLKYYLTALLHPSRLDFLDQKEFKKTGKTKF